ncbi:uncharacterized protein LOC131053449 [Cryptomeria japonica]|uniref:uncharacterized protein LOC131053449 n=1 Tax=Cryptomeria japonica TaxID=3369 RepID=UPI0027DA43D9|nr:uncharacterized protein LOC131053449 [Cryptomeria japonica]
MLEVSKSSSSDEANIGALVAEEAIAEARAKHAAKQAETSSVPTGTSTGVKTRAGKEKATQKEKPVETKKEKPSKIQFQRKGKIVEPLTVPVKTGKRKKQQAQKLVDTDEEVTESKGEKKALRASGKMSKVVGTSTMKSSRKPVTKFAPLENLMINIKECGLLIGVKKLYDKFNGDEQRHIEDAIATIKQDREFIEYILKNLQPEATKEELDEILGKVLGLIPDEEEEVKEVEPKKFEAEDLPNGVKITDFKADEIVLDNQPANTQTEPEIIPDDDDTDINNDDVHAPDNVIVQDIDVEMSKQHEQEQVQGEKKNEDEKKDEEPPVVTQTVDTQPPPVQDTAQDKESGKKEEKKT